MNKSGCCAKTHSHRLPELRPSRRCCFTRNESTPQTRSTSTSDPTHSFQRTRLNNIGIVSRQMLTGMKIADLREELSIRNLKLEGSRSELVERLFHAVQQEMNTSAPNHDASLTYRLRGLRNIKTHVFPNWSTSVWVGGYIPPSIEDSNTPKLVEWLYKNVTNLQLVFLGTGDWLPSLTRNPPSLAIRTTSDTWIFDVGEDTQRQFMKHPLLRPGKVARIFLTSLNGDCVSGLPGILCTIATSRVQGKANSDQPVHVFGPPGTGEFFSRTMECSDTFLEMPVIIHELSREPCSTESCQLNGRAKIWRVRIPCDGLNEAVPYDAHLDALKPLNRKLAKPGKHMNRLNTVDSRAGFRPFPKIPSGDPSKHPLPDDELCWTLRISDELQVKAYSLKEGHYVYRIEEADRAGSLDVDQAISLGVKPGPAFGVLKNGESVTNANGDVITAQMVLSPDRPGRIITVIGDLRATEIPPQSAARADYIVVPAVTTTNGSKIFDAAKAVKFAQSCGAKNLVFGRIQAKAEKNLAQIEQSNVDPLLSVITAFDLYTHVVPNVSSTL